MKTERLPDGNYLHSGNPAEVVADILLSAGARVDEESFRRAAAVCDAPVQPSIAYVVVPVSAPPRKRRQRARKP